VIVLLVVEPVVLPPGVLVSVQSPDGSPLRVTLPVGTRQVG
jgi:hypothetical protein